jgi:hypothetical protein
MKLAFESFEGAACVDHKIHNALKTASKSIFIEKLEKACRGIINHFRRSTKVCISICRALISLISSWLLFYLLANGICVLPILIGFRGTLKNSEDMTRANLGSVIRWRGMIDIYIWIGINEQALWQYIEPPDCVENDDGASFKDHMLDDEQFLCAHQMASVLQHVQQIIATLEEVSIRQVTS